jgi:hypothetical protein
MSGALIAGVIYVPCTSFAQAHLNGAWSGPYNLGFQATNVAVTRGLQDSAKVLMYGASGTPTVQIGSWAFRPAPSMSFPSTTNVRKVAGPAGYNLFCSGLAILPDGKVLIDGGQVVGIVGLPDSWLFDGQTGGRDTIYEQATQAEERWYPTVIEIQDGSMLSLSGLRYTYQFMFGGADNGGPTNTFRQLSDAEINQWQSHDPPTPWPPAREDHAMASDNVFPYGEGRGLILIGGKGASGKLMDVWRLSSTHGPVDPYNTDTTWQWVPLDPNSSNGSPVERSGHSAVECSLDSLWVFGGADGQETELGDVWLLSDDSHNGQWKWKQIQTSLPADNDHPGPRTDHRAILFPHTGTDPVDRMVIFGGTRNGQVLSDTWSLALNGPSVGTWTKVIADNAAHPPARKQYGFVWNALHNDPLYHSQAILFGGRGATLLYNDLWTLKRTGTSFAWTEMANVAGNPPSRRARMGASYDEDMDRLVVFGGETQFSGGGLQNDVFALSLHGEQFWHPVQINSSPTPPSARAGMTLIGDPRGVSAKTPEQFSPSSDPMDGGVWSSWNSGARRLASGYPFMFLMPDGSIIDAGPWTDQDRFLLDGASHTWRNDHAFSLQQAGAAVMYRPGKILRAGARSGSGDYAPGNAGFDTLTPSSPPYYGATYKWELGVNSTLLARSNMNLTILPTGDVLVTGGINGSINGVDMTNTVRAPQIWNAITGVWGNALATEPAIRNYHSAAVLLPDGRVLSTGGEQPNTTYYHTATIYEPPYLFNANDQLATRPTIDAAPQSVDYGETFSIAITTAVGIGSACLIRPGATTHAFNTSQRYVPLEISDGPAGHLNLTAPGSSTMAPPGEYMMFIVDASGVPSIARWVCVHFCDRAAPAATTLVRDDACGTTIGWTAPGDDGNSGKATSYDLRKSSAPITAQNFAGAETISAPTPEQAGVHQAVTPSIGPNGSYFCLMTEDEYGNWSPISNSLRVTRSPDQCGEQATSLWPHELVLGAPQPNPTFDEVSIRFGIPAQAVGVPLELAIFDLAGRRLKWIRRGTSSGGYDVAGWDVTDEGGNRVEKGVYYIRLKVGVRKLTRSLVVLR